MYCSVLKEKNPDHLDTHIKIFKLELHNAWELLQNTLEGAMHVS